MLTAAPRSLSEAPTLRLLDALRAGSPLEVAAAASGLPLDVAASIAGSPLAQALLRRPMP